MTASLRVMTASDIPAAVCLKDTAGWNQTALDWQRFLVADPEGSFVAERDGKVIGTSATITFAGKLAWVGMVIVDAEFRGQGIGKTLLKRAIDYLDGRRIACMKLDATPQGRPLYEKLGFRPEYDVERWLLRRDLGSSPEKHSRAPADLDAVLQLDAEIFGADRSLLLRSVAQHDPELFVVSKKDGEIAGYAFGRRGSRADQFGPWMAFNRDVAEQLLQEFLRRSQREHAFVDCVKPNSWAVELARNYGFEFSRPLTRMFRGENVLAGKPELLGSILGPEFG